MTLKPTKPIVHGRFNDEPLATLAYAFDAEGVVSIRARIDVTRSIVLPALSGIPYPTYKKIAGILRKLDINLDKTLATLEIPLGWTYAPQFDLAAAVSLIASYYQRVVPHEPIFISELTADGGLIAPSRETLDELVRQFSTDDPPALGHIYVMEPRALRYVWEQSPRMKFRIALLEGKTVKDVVTEFLFKGEKGTF